MKTVIITGCAGMFGANFSRHLLDRGYRVIGIDNLSGGYAFNLPKNENFEFWPIDLSDKWSVNAIRHIFSTESPVACYHFAAYAAEGLSPFIRRFNYENNVLASMTVINACIEFDVKLIFTSSMAVYGTQQPPFEESMTPQPIDPYGIAKYTVEQDLAVAADQHRLRYTIVRPHNVIGVYQNIWDRYRNVAGIFVHRVLSEKPMLIYGDGEQKRAFSDMYFYLKPLERLMESGNEKIYNLGGDTVYSINQLALTVKNVALEQGYTSSIEYKEPRHEVKEAWCSHDKAKKELGFFDQTNLEDLVRRIFIWAKSMGDMTQKKMQYEITKGIYEYWK